MGDPKFSRKKFDTPSHPWQGERIAAEAEVVKKYGLKNKTELWKVESLLRTFRQRARALQAKIRYGDLQAEKERDELIRRLDSLGVISKDATLDDILSLNVEMLLARRLQTMAYLKGFSNSPKQARQFIVHGHISISGKKVTIPGYMVKRSEEEAVNYLSYSPLADDLHPARPKDELAETQDVPREVSTEASTGVDPSKVVPAPADKKPEAAAPAKKPVPAPAEPVKKEAVPAAKPEAVAPAKEPVPAAEPAKKEAVPATKPEVVAPAKEPVPAPAEPAKKEAEPAAKPEAAAPAKESAPTPVEPAVKPAEPEKKAAPVEAKKEAE